MKQPRNPWSDGPENITQCPIQPGSNFTQEINFSTEEGTVWWHAHSDWTRATVHGAIIVRPKNGTSYPYTKPYGEKTIVLGMSCMLLLVQIYIGQVFESNCIYKLMTIFSVMCLLKRN